MPFPFSTRSMGRSSCRMAGILTVILALSGIVALSALKVPRAPAANAKNAPASTPKVARQTAHSWTGPADEFEYVNRDQTLRIQQVMDQMGLKRGSVVGDIGAGGGWFTVRAARRVGPQGRVYAEDILKKYVRYVAQRARKEGLANVRTILGTTSDPKLPPNALDAVLILNAYHEFDQPLVMLAKIRAAMKPGARLAFIERDTDELRDEANKAYAATGKIVRRVDERNDNNPYTDDHRLALPIVEREAAEAGFRKISAMELGEDNYLLVVAK